MPFKKLSTDELNSRLAACRADMDKLRSYGASWALDCREMRINEDNVFHINNELRRRQVEEQNSRSSAFKVGDLICFNAAGMRKKSLGLVVALKSLVSDRNAIQVQWAVIPELKPRVHNLEYAGGWSEVDHSIATWYQDDDWFEVVKQN